MNKKLSKLGLVGILSLGLLGSSAYGLEVNEKGFPVPDKTEAELVGSRVLNYNGKRIGVFNQYMGKDESIFDEYIVNNKTASYSVFNDEDPSKSYRLLDNNCDGIFESKYGFREFNEEKVPIPDCYLK